MDLVQAEFERLEYPQAKRQSILKASKDMNILLGRLRSLKAQVAR